jgi:hypothetical protein
MDGNFVSEAKMQQRHEIQNRVATVACTQVPYSSRCSYKLNVDSNEIRMANLVSERKSSEALRIQTDNVLCRCMHVHWSLVPQLNIGLTANR